MERISEQVKFKNLLEMSKLTALADYGIFIETQAPHTSQIMGTALHCCWQIKIDKKKKRVIFSEDSYA